MALILTLQKECRYILDDQHPDLRADFVMANPPFNIKDWWHASLESDVRWKYGTPPQGNANFVGCSTCCTIYHQRAVWHFTCQWLMSSNTNNEGEIRKT